jgi:hypothetical protein
VCGLYFIIGCKNTKESSKVAGQVYLDNAKIIPLQKIETER